MTPPRHKPISVRQLHHHLSAGKFAVPKLQREFVWDGKRAAKLIDSLYRGMPVGSLLVWEATRGDFGLLRRDLNILPPFDHKHARGWFVIDGQQRLSVIYQASKGERLKNSRGQEIDFGRICFIARPSEQNGKLFDYRRPVPKLYVPVPDMLASNWRVRLSSQGPAVLKRVGECRRKLLAYKLPVVVVQSKDLEEVREVFLRINAQGMKITAADRAFARAARIDLRERAHELLNELPENFRSISTTTLLQGFAFLFDELRTDVGQSALERAVDRWERLLDGDAKQAGFNKHWSRYRVGLCKAVDYLRDHFGVLTASVLPSEYMLATLAVFFAEHGRQPNSRQKRQIAQWFWATGVGERYSGRGFRRNLLADADAFDRLASGKQARFKLEVDIDSQELTRREYGKQSSLGNAFFCLLATRKPCFLASGEPIPSQQAAARANRGDRHHIFPQALLKRHGLRPREFNSLVNICLIAKEENQMFGSRAPAKYLADYTRRRHFMRAMQSHLIPHRPRDPLWGRDIRRAYRDFQRQRLALICTTFNTAAGTKLFSTKGRR